MGKIILAILAAAILVAAGFWFYQKDGGSPTVPAGTPPPETNMNSETAPSAGDLQTSETSASQSENVKEFTVSAQNFSFDPSTITVNKGDKVRIVFKSVGGTHDLIIDEFNAATKRVSSGQTDSIEFVADQTGNFEYYCSVGDHRAMGMKG